MSAIDAAEVRAIQDAVRELQTALQALAADPADAGPARVRAIIAIEALEQARKRLCQDMVREMLETGVEQFREGLWTISVRPGRVTATILDAEAVPAEFHKTVPDTTHIRRHLVKHGETNWAALNHGEPYLEIRTSRA